MVNRTPHAGRRAHRIGAANQAEQQAPPTRVHRHGRGWGAQGDAAYHAPAAPIQHDQTPRPGVRSHSTRGARGRADEKDLTRPRVDRVIINVHTDLDRPHEAGAPCIEHVHLGCLVIVHEHRAVR